MEVLPTEGATVRVPPSLSTLLREGTIDSVVRPLKSGKEAEVFLVEIDGGHCVAKVYKEPDRRTFKHRAEYMEGRTVRNSRNQRAMAKRTAYGRKIDDEAWRCAEVEAIYRLLDAGVRVPEPYHFVDGILLMELVQGDTGAPAPCLSDVALSRSEAAAVFQRLLKESVRMLLAGVVHADLSEFNILMASDGPVIIDFPQWVDAAKNQNARELLIRDLDNVMRYLRRFDPSLSHRPYGAELWHAYQLGELTEDTELRGRFRGPVGKVDLDALAAEIDAAEEEHRREIRRGTRSSPGKGRQPGSSRTEGDRPRKGGSTKPEAPRRARPGAERREDAKEEPSVRPPRKRRRRRKRAGTKAGTQAKGQQTARAEPGAKNGPGSSRRSRTTKS